MAKVGLIMGSKSDFDIVKESIDTLKFFGVECDVIVSSAHRTNQQKQKEYLLLLLLQVQQLI